MAAEQAAQHSQIRDSVGVHQLRPPTAAAAAVQPLPVQPVQALPAALAAPVYRPTFWSLELASIMLAAAAVTVR